MIEFLTSVISTMNFPAGVLAFMLIGIAWSMVAAQKDPNFDWSEGFRDETNKVSWTRAGIAISIAISSWTLVFVVMYGMSVAKTADEVAVVLDALFPWFLGSIVVWSGSKSADKLLDILKAWLDNRK